MDGAPVPTGLTGVDGRRVWTGMEADDTEGAAGGTSGAELLPPSPNLSRIRSLRLRRRARDPNRSLNRRAAAPSKSGRRPAAGGFGGGTTPESRFGGGTRPESRIPDSL